MLKAIAFALLSVAAVSAAANPDDPCFTETREIGAIAQARDNGERMQDLLDTQQATGALDDEAEREFYLRFLALAYGNPDWTRDDLEGAVYQACISR